MDRRFKDYYLVTFKKVYGFYGWTYHTTDNFRHFPRFVKTHWHSICGTPYVIASIDKEHSVEMWRVFEGIDGVKSVISYTETKEHDFEMWRKMLKSPFYNLDTKYIIWHCMRQDLFIDWEE